jgi:hypothetical protein
MTALHRGNDVRLKLKRDVHTQFDRPPHYVRGFTHIERIQLRLGCPRMRHINTAINTRIADLKGGDEQSQYECHFV